MAVTAFMIRGGPVSGILKPTSGPVETQHEYGVELQAWKDSPRTRLLPANSHEEIFMLSPEHIAEAARRLVAEAGKPAGVILFGSYARGEADDASDLDLIGI